MSKNVNIKLNVDFTPSMNLEPLISGENISTAFGKLSRCVAETIYQKESLTHLIDVSCKNKLKLVEPDEQPITIDGITYTFSHINGTVTVSGTAENDVTITLGTVNNPTQATLTLSGCIQNGSIDSYYMTIQQNLDVIDTGDITNAPEFNDPSATVQIVIKSGVSFTNDVVFHPMICDKAIYQISPSFAPWAPSNHELYQMILNLPADN